MNIQEIPDRELVGELYRRIISKVPGLTEDVTTSLLGVQIMCEVTINEVPGAAARLLGTAYVPELEIEVKHTTARETSPGVYESA